MPWQGGLNAQRLLWEWNATDTSQLDSPIYVTTSGTPAGFTGSAGVITSEVSRSGNRLQLSGTGSPGGTNYGWIIFPINDLVLPNGLFEVIINTDTYSLSANNRSMALALWADFDTPSAPYCYLTSPISGAAGRCDGVTENIEQASTAGQPITASGSLWRTRVESRIDDPATPRGSVEQRASMIGNGFNQFSWRNAWGSNDGNLGFSGNAAWGGNSAMNQLGLALQATWSSVFASWEINSVEVRTI